MVEVFPQQQVDKIGVVGMEGEIAGQNPFEGFFGRLGFLEDGQFDPFEPLINFQQSGLVEVFFASVQEISIR